MKGEYRILKLKNGENLIAQIKRVNRENGSVIVHRPFMFKTVTMYSDFGTPTEEKLFIQKYNQFSVESIVELPTAFVASVLIPDSRLIEVYDKEKCFEDNPKLRFLSRKKEEHKAFQEFIKKKEKLQEMADEIESMEDENPLDNFSALMLPNEALQQLLEMMGLDWNLPKTNDESDMFTDKPHESLEEDPEDWGYGNRWQDWNLEDFIDE